MVTSSRSYAQNPQLSLGDKISIYSDKAYRKNNGKYFEAVGNVVIIGQTDTIYGELASLDQETNMVKIEGNVRIINKDMTIYGSHLDYNITTGVANIRNARIITLELNLVATQLTRLSESEYIAKEAEFSTCKDCPESWSIYGKTIRVHVNRYVEINHALTKVKGVNVIYLPYIALPIGSKRKSGLLFPLISNRPGEGFAVEQPIFWAIDESKDATFGPTFWASRGYGGDLEYRQRFSQRNWFKLDSRIVNDKIYEPGNDNQGPSGDEFFRYFAELETHQQWSANWNSHMHYLGSRDLDFVRDNMLFTDPKVNSSELGFKGHLDWRQERFALSTEVNYLRNQLFSDPTEFDRTFVQELPRVGLSATPYTLVQSQTPGLEKITLGLDSSYSRFRQVDELDATYLRNTDRFSAQPFINWNLFTVGPVAFKSRFMLDQQSYFFADHREASAGKNAGVFRTEMSFTMDKIFGLAYEETIPVKYIPARDLKKLRDNKEQGLTPIKTTVKENRLVGDIPTFEKELASETITQVKNSYRHVQDFKFVHHYISSENDYGNERFLEQIKGPREGMFDFEDAIRSREYLSGSVLTRTTIPLYNTVEFQWNNSLIKKTPKSFNYFDDDKYLRDNFTYGRIGYFNVSQGYQVDTVSDEPSNRRLTRLLVTGGYGTGKWSVGFSESYFHYINDNIFNVTATRMFDYFNVFSNYNQSTFQDSKTQLLSFGGMIRPTDSIGFAMAKDMDLEGDQNLRTSYGLDIMPDNNCWILSLSYREALDVKRYMFNIIFNFGDKKFHDLRSNYFGAKRLR